MEIVYVLMDLLQIVNIILEVLMMLNLKDQTAILVHPVVVKPSIQDLVSPKIPAQVTTNAFHPPQEIPPPVPVQPTNSVPANATKKDVSATLIANKQVTQ